MITLDKFTRLAAHNCRSISIKVTDLDGSTEVLSTELGVDVVQWMLDHGDYVVTDFTYGCAKEFLFEVTPKAEDPGDIDYELFLNILRSTLTKDQYNEFMRRVMTINNRCKEILQEE